MFVHCLGQNGNMWGNIKKWMVVVMLKNITHKIVFLDNIFFINCLLIKQIPTFICEYINIWSMHKSIKRNEEMYTMILIEQFQNFN